MANETIEGIKLILHTGGTNIPDDPSFPYKLYANLRPPELMDFTFIVLYGGSEEVIVRGMTVEAIEAFITQNQLETHPRLRRLIITGPEDKEIRRTEK